MYIDVVSCKIWRLDRVASQNVKGNQAFKDLTTGGNLSKFCKKGVYAFFNFL